jgi:hypothetical protein
MLQNLEVREMIRLLELARAPELTSEKAAAVWREIQRRAASAPAMGAAGTGDLVRRLQESVIQVARELVASLVPDTLIPSGAVRSTATELPKVLVYETDDLSISISFAGHPGSERLRLIGQVAPKTEIELPAGGRIAVFSEREMFATNLDEFGEFIVQGVPPGNLHMDILLGSDAIQISPIQTQSVQVMEE